MKHFNKTKFCAWLSDSKSYRYACYILGFAGLILGSIYDLSKRIYHDAPIEWWDDLKYESKMYWGVIRKAEKPHNLPKLPDTDYINDAHG